MGEVLRQVEAGEEFTVTVRGRPVARIGPIDVPPARRVDVDLESLRQLLAETRVDAGFADDVAELREREEPAGEPWSEP